MKQYLALVQDVLTNGSWQDNRTGIRTKSVHGAMLRFDLQDGFPAVTTKRLAFKSVIGELIGFLRATRSAAQFRDLGCNVWNQNANENTQWLANPYRLKLDDLGSVYGVQWREWPAYKLIDLAQPQGAAQLSDALQRGFAQVAVIDNEEEPQGAPKVLVYKAIDQLRACLDTIMTDPGSRRILFHGWNVAQLDEMALPPCHLLYQFLVNQESREISVCLYLRSNDLGLGLPFNAASVAALLHLVGRLSGYAPKWVTVFIADAHIYETHLDMLEEQITRDPYPAPQLSISTRVPDYALTGRYEPEWLTRVEPSDFSLTGYHHHPHLTGPMAV